VLADFEAKILSEVRRPTQVEEGFESVMARTADVIDELRTFPLEGGKRIYGIGLAVAGLINRSRNIVEFSPDFHWQSVDVVEALSHRHPLRIVFDNVTRVMALGEMCFGLGRTYRNLVCINLGYGIGSGIIIDGKPLFGPLGMAGEFGHMTMDRGSRVLCECGNHGCLEALSSGRAIAQAGRNAILAGDRGSMFDIAGGVPEKVSAQTVIEAARQGDQTALEIFDSAMEYLGLGISSLINIFSPEVVVIGGGVAQAGDFLFDKIRSTVKARALAKIASRVIIRPASFGLDTTVLGAVALVLNEVVSLNGHHGKVVR
jgi:glucokinase-like ROK family protein